MPIGYLCGSTNITTKWIPVLVLNLSKTNLYLQKIQHWNFFVHLQIIKNPPCFFLIKMEFTLSPLDCWSEIQVNNKFFIFNEMFALVLKHLIVSDIINFSISLYFCLLTTIVLTIVDLIHVHIWYQMLFYQLQNQQ